MNVAVWDTYVTKKDGSVMHFDIIVPATLKNETTIYEFGRKYLVSKNQEGQPLTSEECRFCHVEQIRPSWQKAIEKDGYFIYEMKNCN
ncbi:MAG: DUF2024 family protein [Chitinophagales bacterium]|nr:DUF2024 family protein [Chitinophagales bacterium]